MDPQDRKPEQKPEPDTEEQFVKPTVLGDVRRRRKTDWGKVLLVILLIMSLAAGGAGYWWRDKQAKDADKRNQSQINELMRKLQDQAAKEADENSGDETAPTVPTQTMIDNIKAVFATSNTQPLSTYMTAKVKVILAASEGIGDRSPAEAASDIESFMKNAGVAWNFSLPGEMLTKYRAGFYKEYFPENAVVGKSDDLVISFSFDNDGKIKTVFMTNAEAVLFE